MSSRRSLKVQSVYRFVGVWQQDSKNHGLGTVQRLRARPKTLRGLDKGRDGGGTCCGLDGVDERHEQPEQADGFVCCFSFFPPRPMPRAIKISKLDGDRDIHIRIIRVH